MHCLGVSGGISVKTGLEKERTLGGDGSIDTFVSWERVRILILGGMSISGSFCKVRGFFSAAFFARNLVMRFTFLSTLDGLL